MPRSYGNVRAEYEAIRHGVAVIDLSPAGKLEVSGKNAVQFINGLVTNEVKNLPAGDGVQAAFLDTHGKVSALCRIYNTGHHLLLQLDAARREKIYKNLSRFVLAGEFFLTDVTEQQALISLQGLQSAALIESLTGQTISGEDSKISEGTITDTSVLIATHSRCANQGLIYSWQLNPRRSSGRRSSQAVRSLARARSGGRRLKSPASKRACRVKAQM